MNRTFGRVLLMIGCVGGALLGASRSAPAVPVAAARTEIGVDYVSSGVGVLGSGCGTITGSGVCIHDARQLDPAVCGDGVLGSGELCDDGNLIDGDGCDGDCTVQCPKWEVDFSLLTAAANVGALQLSVDYSSAAGDFAGAGPTVECTSHVSGVQFAADDDETTREVGLGWVTETGFSGPQLLATCTFGATGFPGLEQLQLSVVDASDIDLNPISVSVGVELRETPDRFDCAAYCGDGFTQPANEETCDDGNTVNGDACSNTCQPAICGDGVTQVGIEQCDDGNLIDADGCDAKCAFPCPKWEVDFSLADASASVGALQLSVDYAGTAGDFVGSGHTVQCTNRVRGALFAGVDDEEAQALNLAWATESGFSAPHSLATCTFDAAGVPSPGEFSVNVADAAGTDLNPITASIVLDVRGTSECPGFCGDSTVAFLEECDDGNYTSTDGCTNACQVALCGDGFEQPANDETCDDANRVNTDDCTNLCQTAACGDAFVHVGVEQCDDGNSSNGDACLDTCTTARCGDGFIRISVEQCDDANSANTDSCLNTCHAATCGDGYLRAGVELCDDGNLSNADGCPTNCKPAVCGDGFIRIGFEQCDDANSSDADACPGTCNAARCGDGFVRTGFEQCDDGNSSNTDGCPTNCKAATCGDGFVQQGVEECDDANTTGGDGCSAGCQRQRICGDATGDGKIVATDALRELRRAVGQDVDCPDWACDVNDDGKILTVDALLVLNVAVGLPAALVCGEPTALVLRLMTPDALGALQFQVDYTGAGELPGDGNEVHCEGLVSGASFAFLDMPSSLLNVAMIALDGFSGPRSIARCEFMPRAYVGPEDFVVTILDASAPSTEPVQGVEVQALPY
ncbi:MAG: DUF4215 domain-containing protein [Deltaproteobacteria bacterium]|nr:DUF4215 domain-containing protein [Deltaproteobacteria bacterium]